MLDIREEKLISLLEAAALIPPARNGAKTYVSTLTRWILDGAKSPTGERVRLEAKRCGGRWMTSREAINRFMESLTPRVESDEKITIRSNQRSRTTQAEKAMKELERMGV